MKKECVERAVNSQFYDPLAILYTVTWIAILSDSYIIGEQASIPCKQHHILLLFKLFFFNPFVFLSPHRSFSCLIKLLVLHLGQDEVGQSNPTYSQSSLPLK